MPPHPSGDQAPSGWGTLVVWVGSNRLRGFNRYLTLSICGVVGGAAPRILVGQLCQAARDWILMDVAQFFEILAGSDDVEVVVTGKLETGEIGSAQTDRDFLFQALDGQGERA